MQKFAPIKVNVIQQLILSHTINITSIKKFYFNLRNRFFNSFLQFEVKTPLEYI